MNVAGKMERLQDDISNRGSIVVAYSGGVDSTFLAAVACKALGGKALAVTARSPTYPVSEQEAACRIAADIGIRHELIDSNELDIPEFTHNPPDRCYHCKRQLFARIRELADERGIKWIADGSNADDINDYRPGSRAAREAGVISPLRDAGLSKADIRELSSQMGLETAGKPSLACLASRFPYGETISDARLRVVDACESAIRDLGFRDVRVRHHGDLARVEIGRDEMARLADPGLREQVSCIVKKNGFLYAALDLDGYVTGSMNRVLQI